jgi:hypothetical protein
MTMLIVNVVVWFFTGFMLGYLWGTCGYKITRR